MNFQGKHDAGEVPPSIYCRLVPPICQIQPWFQTEILNASLKALN